MEEALDRSADANEVKNGTDGQKDEIDEQENETGTQIGDVNKQDDRVDSTDGSLESSDELNFSKFIKKVVNNAVAVLWPKNSALILAKYLTVRSYHAALLVR